MKNLNPQLKGGLTNSRPLNILIVITLSLLLIYGATQVYSWQKNKSSNQLSLDQIQRISQVKKTNIDFSKFPEKFPNNIPVEEGVEITQNYNAATPDGRLQATRSFITKKSLVENIGLYTNFLEKDGWKTTVSKNDPTFMKVTGSKVDQKLIIAVDENQASKKKTVTITYMEL